MTTVILFGATGATGLALSKLLLKKGFDLYAAARKEKDREHLGALGANAFLVDALNADQVVSEMSNITNKATVISLVGGASKAQGTRSDFLGNKNIIKSAVDLKFKRLIFITSIGSGESKPHLPDVLKPILGPIADEKTKAENILRNSGLDFTIIRPGQLTNDSSTGDGLLTEECILGSMSREDLALMIIKCLEDKTTIGKIYSALDSNKKLDLSWIKK